MTEISNGLPQYAPRSGTLLADLGDRGLLAVEGPEAAKFLQGQVTCDIRELAAGVSRRGAHCNPKGRMLFSFQALQPEDERVLLSMHRGLLADASAALGRYSLFSKAELRDVSDDWRLLGLAGPDAATLLSSQWGTLPEGDDQWLAVDGGLLLRLDETRYQCWLSPNTAAALWQALAPSCCTGDQRHWTLLDIRAGLGEVRPATRELFSPQALNFQLTNGISFNKGCYTGQEVVARLHYRGKLKRHMYRLAGALDDGGSLPEPGDKLVHSETGQGIGQVVMAAPTGTTDDPSFELLADIADSAIAQASLADDGTQQLVHLPLPYAIPG